MKITNHGTWQRYYPTEPHPDAPANTMYARRVGDGIDWYDFVADNRFLDGSIKMTVLSSVVMAATHDASMLFPAGTTLLEVSEVSVDDPQKLFGGRVYVADRQDFDEAPPPPAPPDLNDVLRRLEALEGKA